MYKKSHAIWDHTVIPAAVSLPPLHQLKVVLDLATLEGCRPLMVVVISMVTYLINNLGNVMAGNRTSDASPTS